MYRVLLVDDEPLILSGIRFMIDWKKNECELVGTARNGRQAIEVISNIHPDIVVADINMPVMNGLELMKQILKDYPDTVFIMLTNLQEFELVREALRLQAVDYIIKTQMEPQLLEESLARAKIEADQRNSLGRMRLAASAQQQDVYDLQKGAVRQLLQQGSLSAAAARILEEAGILAGYGLIKLWFSPAFVSAQNDPRQLLMWALEMVAEVAENCFPRHLLLETEGNYLYILYFKLPQNQVLQRQELFCQKLTSVASNVMGARPYFLFTSFFYGEKSCKACKDELAALNEYYYLTGGDIIYAQKLPALTYQKLALDGIAHRLRTEINNRSVTGCTALFKRITDQLSEIPHERLQAVWICSEIYLSACKAFEGKVERSSYFDDFTAGSLEIEELSTKSEVLTWLKKACNEIINTLEPLSSSRLDMLNQVRRFVTDHIEQRITLQDAANHICISPSYLSSLFKKEYRQGFVDFVNQAKMEQACRMIAEGNTG